MQRVPSTKKLTTAENAVLPMYPLLDRQQCAAIANAWSRGAGQQGCCHLYMQGWRYRERGQLDAALRAFRELLILSRRWGHQGWMGAAEKAIADLVNLLDLGGQRRQSTITAADLAFTEQCSRAVLLCEQRRWQQAIQVYEQVLAAATQAEYPLTVGCCLNGLGLIYLEQARYFTAETYFQATVVVLADLEVSTQRAIALHNLGLVHYCQGHHQLAQSCLKAALQCWQTTTNDLGVALTLDYLGRTYADEQEAWLALGSFEAAADVLDNLAKHQDVRFEAAALLIQMALLCERSRHHDLAIAYWKTALKIYQTLSLTEPQILIWRRLSQLHQGLGHSAIARYYVNCVMQASDS